MALLSCFIHYLSIYYKLNQNEITNSEEKQLHIYIYSPFHLSKKTLLHQDSICIDDTFQMVYFMLKDHCGKSFHGFCNHLTFVYIKVSYRD